MEDDGESNESEIEEESDESEIEDNLSKDSNDIDYK